MVALTISAKILNRHFDSAINAEKLLVGLEHIRRHIGKPFILIWDRSRAHRSHLVKAYLAKHPEIHREYLPPYARELYPEEYCQSNPKRRMINGVCHAKAEIRKNLDRGLARLRKCPDILLGCFHHAGLGLTQLW